MNLRTFTWILVLAGYATLAVSLPLTAQEQPQRPSHNQMPRITVFEDGNASNTNPSQSPCYSNCPGTTAFANNLENATVGYYYDDNAVAHGLLRAADGSITTLDAPGAGSTKNSQQGTVAYSINLEGEIAGQFEDSSNGYHGFVRSKDGNYTQIDVRDAGPIGTFAVAINWEGTVAGYFYDANNNLHGFVRTRDGRITQIDGPGACTLTDNTNCTQTLVSLETGINAEGSIIGWYFGPDGVNHGYVRSPDGTMTTIDVPGTPTNAVTGTIPASINARGEIAGGYSDSNMLTHGFVRHCDGTFDSFDAPGTKANPVTDTFAVGIAASGTTTGYYVDSYNVSYGFVRLANGTLLTFEAPGTGTGNGQGTTPQSINDLGFVTGYSTDSSNVNHGFVRCPDAVFYPWPGNGPHH